MSPARCCGVRFGYCFRTPAGSDYPPILTEHRIAAGRAGRRSTGPAAGSPACRSRCGTGKGEALGFRFGDFAYVNDVSAVPDETRAGAVGPATSLVVDALRHTPHPTHFSVSEALAFIERIRPQHAVLTNMHTDVDYADLAARLPAGRRASLRRHAPRAAAAVKDSAAKVLSWNDDLPLVRKQVWVP